MLLAAVAAAAVLATPAAAATFSPPISATVPDTSLVFPSLQLAVAGGGEDVLAGSGSSLLGLREGALAPAALPALPPRVAQASLVGAGTTALAVWRRDRPERGAGIEIAERAGDGTWGAPIAIAGASFGGVTAPALAANRRGDAVVAFVGHADARHPDKNGEVLVAYRARGGSFSTPQRLGRDATAPRVAVGGDGLAAVTWREHGAIRAALVDAHGAGAPRTLGQGQDEAVGVRPDGGVVVAWTSAVVHVTGRTARVTGLAQAAFRPPGGRFGPSRRVAAFARTSFGWPRIVIGAHRAIVTWSAYDTPGGVARTRLWQRPVPGTEPATLLVDGVARPGDTDVIGRSDGSLAAVWTTRGGRGLPLRPWAGTGPAGAPLTGVRLDGAGPPAGSQAGRLQPVPDSADIRVREDATNRLAVAWRTYGAQPGTLAVSLVREAPRP